MSPVIKCPSCGHVSIQGADRCEQCFYTLMQRDLPMPIEDDQYQFALMTAPVSALITGKDLLVASPNDTVEQLVKIFQDREKHYVVVYDRHKLVGVISHRDLLLKVAGQYDDLSEVTVGEIMTPNPEFVRADVPIAYAVNKMATGGFRHIPVLRDDGTPYSIINIGDVLRFLTRHTQGGETPPSPSKASNAEKSTSPSKSTPSKPKKR